MRTSACTCSAISSFPRRRSTCWFALDLPAERLRPVLHQERQLVLTDVSAGGQQVSLEPFDLGAVAADQGRGGGLDLGQGPGLLLQRQDRLAASLLALLG